VSKSFIDLCGFNLIICTSNSINIDGFRKLGFNWEFRFYLATTRKKKKNSGGYFYVNQKLFRKLYKYYIILESIKEMKTNFSIIYDPHVWSLFALRLPYDLDLSQLYIIKKIFPSFTCVYGI
jgi:hypothetical protein